uniref:Leucine-rich repeat protein n=1 Tax=Podoviridae sp. ctoqT5 TaxID=2826577 RepID=A0A8S5MPB6_9CAUD|nr:MAG TPA: leucine-rich repeat protein [Podoviridae sp. ctoqT5]
MAFYPAIIEDMSPMQYAQDGWTESSISDSNVTIVRDYAFANNKTIETVDFPSLKVVKQYAFAFCSKLKSIDLSDITELGESAFQQAALEGALSLTKYNPSSVAKYIFRGNKFTSISIPLAKVLGHSMFIYCDQATSVNLPLVETMNDWTFAYCTKLKTVTLPKIKTLTRYTFGYSGLEKLVLPNSVVCTIAADTFIDTPIAQGTGYVYVPDNLLNSYKSATNWAKYADQIKSMSELEG